MKKIVLSIGAVVLVVAATVLARTARFTSTQPYPEPAAHVTVDAEAAAAHLSGAVRFQTISFEEPDRVDRAAFAALHAYLEATYPSVHATLAREVVNQSSLLFTWQGSDATFDPMVLMGHLDVVPVVPGTEDQWSHQPFAGDIADGFVWGRGAMDDKSSVIAVLEAIEKLVDEGFRPRRTIYLAFGHDEEVGGPEGAARIADALDARGVARYAFVNDEGGAVGAGLVPGLATPAALIGIAEKGYLNLRLNVAAEGGHSSTPPAETAIGILSRAIARLEATPFPARLDGPARDMLATLGPEMPFGQKLAAANLWLFRPLVERAMLKNPQAAALLRTTTAPTMMSAGVKANVLPPEATAVVNFRIKPGETMDTVEAFVREVIGDPRVALERVGDGKDPSAVSDTSGPAFKTMARTIRQVLPPDVVIAPMLLMGGTDAKYYSARSPNVFRFLPAVITPEDFKRFHGTNERVAIDGLATSIRYFYQLVRNVDGMSDAR